LLKKIRDGMKKQSINLEESGLELAKLGHKLSDDKLLDVAKKVIHGQVTLDGKVFK